MHKRQKLAQKYAFRYLKLPLHMHMLPHPHTLGACETFILAPSVLDIATLPLCSGKIAVKCPATRHQIPYLKISNVVRSAISAIAQNFLCSLYSGLCTVMN